MAAGKQALLRLNAVLGYKLLWRTDWALTKLSFPDKFKGYERTWTSVLEVAGLSIVSGSLLTLLCLKVWGRKRRQREALLLWAVFTLNMVLVVLGVGRQHLWLEMRKVILPFHLSESPGSCSGSILLVPTLSSMRFFQMISDSSICQARISSKFSWRRKEQKQGRRKDPRRARHRLPV